MGRRTHAKTAHDGGQRETLARAFQPVKLECGHESRGWPPLSNPDRWWCCSAWQPVRRGK